MDYENMVNKSEKDIIYMLKMGMIDLSYVPEHLRTYDVCREALRMNPMQYRLVPPLVREQFTEAERERYKEYDKEEKPSVARGTGRSYARGEMERG